MPADHDRISQPAKGWCFPLPHARVLKLVRQAGFQPPESSKRLRVNYVNAAGDARYGQLMLCFQPRRALTCYSIRSESSVGWASFCTLVGLQRFLHFDAAPSGSTVEHRSMHQVHTKQYELYSNYGNQLLIREVSYSGAVSKYRAGTKFSHAFKPRWKIVQDQILERYDCRQKRQALMAAAAASLQSEQPFETDWTEHLR